MKILLLALTLSTGAAFAAEPPTALQACIVCHSTTQDTNRIGPSLFGVIGRKAGSVPGFNYSTAMKGAGLRWTAQDLDAFIANPQQKVPGNHMPFSGLPDAKQRAEIVAYLGSLH